MVEQFGKCSIRDKGWERHTNYKYTHTSSISENLSIKNVIRRKSARIGKKLSFKNTIKMLVHVFL